MRKTKELLVLFIICLFFSLIFQMSAKRVYAESKNDVTLNFDGATIEDDGAAFYPDLGRILLLKDDVAINITNNMKIDLNEAKYEIQVIGYYTVVGEPDSVFDNKNKKICLSINDWYYGLNKNCGVIEFNTNKFSGNLNIKLIEYNGVKVNTRVENVYDNITSTGTIDLTNDKTFVIDFDKNDELTNGLKLFADVEKTLYYKNNNGSLIKTDDENEAVIKIVGNKSENKAILSAVNIKDKKEEKFKGLYTKYTGSKLQYDGTIEDVINETRTDYYTKCTYDFTFKYADENSNQKEYTFIEGANQIYTIDESKDATFKIDADYKLFANKIYVDNKLLDVSNYNSKSGSTIIILKDEYLKTLSIGKHTLKVAFSDGKNAVTNFEIKSKQANINVDNNNENNEEQENSIINNNAESTNIQKENNSTNPKTGDNIITNIILFVGAIIAILSLAIVNKNRKRK